MKNDICKNCRYFKQTEKQYGKCNFRNNIEDDDYFMVELNDESQDYEIRFYNNYGCINFKLK